MFKKILVPIDGSDAALNAVTVAKNIAEKYGPQEVILIHVFPMSHILQDEYISNSSSIEMPNFDEFELFNKAEEVFKNTGIKINLRLEHGFVWDSIVNAAQEERVDLIVISNRGLGGLKSFLLGSVSKQVVDDAPCSVLVVK